MSALLEAKNKMRELATKAQTVVGDETKSFAERREELDKIEADIKGFAEQVSVYEQAQRLLSAGGDAAPEAKSDDAERRVAKTLGQQIVESDAYAIAKEAGASWKRFSASVELKTINTIDEGTGLSNGFPNGMAGAGVIPDYLPGIVDLRFRKLLIADLLAQGSTTSSSISYLKETAFQNSAAGRAEKGKAASSDDAFGRVQEQVGAIGHIAKMTDEMLQDAPQLASFVQNRLVFGVRLKEDDALLNGAGYPSVLGLLQRSGLATAISGGTTGTLAAPTKVIDAIYNQITALRFNAFVEPDAILFNPTDWQNIRLAKDANSQYYAGGPFSGAYGNGGYSNVDALWGLRAVITPAIAAGTMLVGGFQECAQLFRRQGVTLEMTNSNVDDFENHLVTARAEERLALAVYRPGGLGAVTVTWA
jgi:HK97 family phage major capsid protein